MFASLIEEASFLQFIVGIQFIAKLHIMDANLARFDLSLLVLFEALAGHGWPSLSIMAGAMVTVLGLIVLAAVKD